MDTYILDGFGVLAQCPDWYKGALGVAIGAAFGMRQYANWTMSRLSKQAMVKNLGLEGPIGPAPSGKIHKSFKLTRKGITDALREKASDIAEDIKEEFNTDVEE